MKQTRIHPGQSIGLPLTSAERKLLEDLILDDELIERIRNADPDKPEVPFTLDELDLLAGFVAAEANHTSGKKEQKALDAIFERITELLDRYTDEDNDVADKDPIVIDLTSLDPDPITLEDQVVQQLHALAEELDQACEAAGLDLDDVLEQMTPTQIETDDTIKLNLTPTEKQMLLDLADLDAEIANQIRQTPKSRRKFEFTLRQISLMENAVATEIERQPSQATSRKWERLDGKLIEIQAEYACGDEPQGSLGRMLAGESVSRGAAVRDLLAKVLEERKAKKK